MHQYSTTHGQKMEEEKIMVLFAYLDGIEQTKLPTGWVVESRLPLTESLQTVHHTTVVTICGRGDETLGDITTSEKSCGM